MSLVLDTRDVPLGPTAAASGLDASPPYSADLRGCGDSRRASACYVGGDGVLAGASQKRAGLQSKFGGSEEDASSESSSIGVPDDSDGGSDDEDEVQSTLSLGSLEDSLPIKRRGLSNYYTGRSKSFANLTEVRSVNDLGKAESPFNKRRRSLIAYKLSNNLKKSSFYGHSSHISMPLLPLNEEDDGSGVDDGDGDGDSSVSGGRGCDIRAATKQRTVTVNEDEDVEEDDERPNKSHKSLGFLLY